MHRRPAPVLTGFAAHTRGFVQVQAGCDHRCTFCTIPFGRGRNRSVPWPRWSARSPPWSTRGVQEVVLTGVDIASHGDGIGGLAAAVLRALPGLKRLRLSSIDPAAIDARSGTCWPTSRASCRTCICRCSPDRPWC